MPATRGTAGEWNVLVTETGLVVVQWIIPPGGIIPSHITLLDANGSPIVDRASLDRILALEPELASYELLVFGESQPVVPSSPVDTEETIVEVKGGSQCFEFQFPAAPEHFVGRSEVLAEIAEVFPVLKAASPVSSSSESWSIANIAKTGSGRGSNIR